jgi:hypothetical protein
MRGCQVYHSDWRGFSKWFPMNILVSYLVSKGRSEESCRAGRHVGWILEFNSGEAHQQRNSIRNPIIQVFHSWMCKRTLGRMREMKVTDTELNCLYSALIARQPIDPSYLMINRWCCEATSGSGDIGSGCYLSMLAISLRPGILRNPEHLLPGTSLGFEYLKQGKYISGDESVVWTSLGPLPRWVPGPTTRWAPGTTRLALHDT